MHGTFTKIVPTVALLRNRGTSTLQRSIEVGKYVVSAVLQGGNLHSDILVALCGHHSEASA